MSAGLHHLGKLDLARSDTPRFNRAQVVSEELPDGPRGLLDAAPPKVVLAFDELHRGAIGVRCRQGAQGLDRDE